MRKFALLAGVSGIALAIAHPAAASDFEPLCGETLTEDTEVKDVIDTVTSSCEIILANGVELSIKNSSISVQGDLTILAQTTPTDNTASLEIKGTALEVDDHLAFLFKAGKVEITKDKPSGDGNLFMVGDGVSINTTYGNIEVKDSDFEVTGSNVSISASGEGKVEVKNNGFDLESSLSIDTNSGSLEVAGNDIMIESGDSFDISSVSGDIEVKGNQNIELLVSVDISISSETGDVEVKNNTLSMTGGTVTIGSMDGKVEVKFNDFGDPDDTKVSTNGDCETKNNTPELTCEIP